MKDETSIESFSPLPIVRSQKSRMYRNNRLPEKPEEEGASRGRFPSWLHRPAPQALEFHKTSDAIVKNRVYTVCEEASCPNIVECYSKKTATFLLLGKSCTRACGFCDIEHALHPLPLDPEEPERIAESAYSLGLRHVVLTMVARDDLSDGGACQVAKTIAAIRVKLPLATCEVLISDLMGKSEALDIIMNASPEIFNHNLETVEKLTPKIRHQATYRRSLFVLEYAKKHIQSSSYPYMLTKSGIMLGLGETQEEVYQTLKDLRDVSVDIVTIGQYLQASQKKLPVRQFIHPKQFQEYKEYAEMLGIPNVYSGPFVRSSYNAELFVEHRVTGKRERIESI